MINPWKIRNALRRLGVVGINQRNTEIIMRYNPRHLYPLVDNKLSTKVLALANKIAVPDLYQVIKTENQGKALAELLNKSPDVVIKPACGSGGNGILILNGMLGDYYRKPDGRLISIAYVKHHVSNILSGMYSLGGVRDQAFLEYRVIPDPLFNEYAFQGVPDIRVIVFRGVPLAAMLRLPTRASDGKANLHQGALGVGIHMDTGLTSYGVCNNRMSDQHPDTHKPIAGLKVPNWRQILKLAIQCADAVGLGYLGVDIVIDAVKGPLVLELNARPGLNVQLANGMGLAHLFKKIEVKKTIPTDPEHRLELIR